MTGMNRVLDAGGSLLFQMVNTLFSLALCVVLDYANYTALR